MTIIRNSALVCFALIFSFLTLTSCDNDRITGSDTITSEIRDLATFNSIEIHDVVHATIRIDNDFYVEVRTNQNMQDRVLTQVNNGELDVFLKSGNYDDIDVDVTIHTPSLDHLTLRDASYATATNIEANTLSIDVHDSAELSTSGDLEQLNLEVKDAGEFVGLNLSTEGCSINVKDAGEADIHVINNLTGNISDAGKVRYKGDPVVDVDIRDAGKLIHLD